jgi:hypothetical protein
MRKPIQLIVLILFLACTLFGALADTSVRKSLRKDNTELQAEVDTLKVLVVRSKEQTTKAMAIAKDVLWQRDSLMLIITNMVNTNSPPIKGVIKK